MATPTSGGTAFKLAGSQVLPVTDLTLPTALGSGAAASGSFTTALGAQVIVMAQLSSGTSMTLKLGTGAASSSISFASATVANGQQATVTQSGFSVVTVQTSATSPWCGVSLLDTGSGSGFATNFAIFCLYVTELGENHSSVRTGYQAVASKLLGNGSGVFSNQLSPTVG